MTNPPIAFFSYVRDDDAQDSGRLSLLRDRLQSEISIHLGSSVTIFQDRKSVGWGQNWKRRIDDALDTSTFLIPIITPRFFNSVYCRSELERFAGKAKKFDRPDLILPLYYVEALVMEDEERQKRDDLAVLISKHQYEDWRSLRWEPWDGPAIGKAIAAAGKKIVEAIHRSALEKREQTSVENPFTRTAEKRSELVVDVSDIGGYNTIAEAIAAAKPGHRISVRPGIYSESLIIRKDIEIVGDGELGSVVIEAVSGSAITFRSDKGLISNLTLRQRNSGLECTVEIEKGELRIQGCDISSAKLGCIGIQSGANPYLVGNRIHGSLTGGVIVSSEGRGMIEDNRIEGNLFGIVIYGTRVEVRRNVINNSSGSGVVVYADGQAFVEANRIIDNEKHGILIMNSADAKIHDNDIKRNRQYGVWLESEAKGVVERNVFAENGKGVLYPAAGVKGVSWKANDE